jgi:hypothetical protein
LDTVWRELYNGYQTAQEAQRRLERSWKMPIEKMRRQKYTQELKVWERRFDTVAPEVALERKRYLRRLAHWRIQQENFARSQAEWRYFKDRLSREKKKLRVAQILGTTLGVVFGLTIVGIPIALFMIYWIYRQNEAVVRALGVCPPKPQAPVKPQEPDFTTHVGPKPELNCLPAVSFAVEPDWWQSIKIMDWSERNFGTIGVHIFLETLKRELPDDFLAFREIPVQQGLDVDVLLIAPNGLWLFECKHLSGLVTCENNKWFQFKEFFLPGGVKEQKEIPFDEPLDDQWLREQKNTSDTLNRRLPYLSWLTDHIHGGIVFTHENVRLKIDKSCKVTWGVPQDWKKIILAEKPLPHYNLFMQLKTADALVTFANRINNELGSRSSVDLVQQYASRVEQRLKKMTEPFTVRL